VPEEKVARNSFEMAAKSQQMAGKRAVKGVVSIDPENDKTGEFATK